MYELIQAPWFTITTFTISIPGSEFSSVLIPRVVFNIICSPKRRIGHWLPQDHTFHHEFLRRASRSADLHLKEHKGRLSPAIEEFRAFIEGNPRVYMYFVMMFEEIPQKEPYINDPTGTKQIRDYEHMLGVFDHIFGKAPEWTDAANGVGLVGVPMCAILDYPMGTPSGYAAFLDPDVNRMFKKILNEWGKFLQVWSFRAQCPLFILNRKTNTSKHDQTPKSAEVLGDHTTGWFGETGLTSLMSVANAPLSSSHKFEDMYICDPSAPHYGYESWDDFFTRQLRPDARPVASPNDDNIIANACESRPYNVEPNAKLRDRFWAKGQPYSLLDMLGHDRLATEQFDGGTVYQAFLSALSYHRWHSPVSGKIRHAFVRDGTYFSEPLFEGVGDPSGNREEIDTQGIVLAQGYLSSLATRAIIFIEADNPAIGLMAFVGIGMDEVSTCDITVKQGQRVKKGDELGMFHFGGSSHCLVFRKEVKLEGFPDIGREHNVPVRGKLVTVKA